MPTSARFSRSARRFAAPTNHEAHLCAIVGLALVAQACSGSSVGKLFPSDLTTVDASTDKGPGSVSTDAGTDSPVEAPEDGGACGTGKKFCNAECVAKDGPATGCSVSGCDPCSVPHAVAGCVGGACGVGTCEAGYGDCDQAASGCETNLTTNPLNCGACGNRCGAGDVCSAGVCQHSCGNGLTTCGASCVNVANNTEHCGGCGKVCSGTAGGTPTCNNFQCGLACGAGYHLCNGACVSDASVSSCGASCVACPTPFNGTATCNGSCGVTCNVGSHGCGGLCVTNTSVTSCGSSCVSCPAILNGDSTCDGVACGFSCRTGFHTCGGQCASNTSPATCGSSCTPCTAAPPNATPMCTGVGCDFACNPGFARSGPGCISAPLPTLALGPTAGARVSGTFYLPAVSSPRLGAFDACPNATMGPTLSNYQYVQITNPSLQTATVSIWTSLAPTPGAPILDTIMASYSTPPVDDAQRKACVKGVADNCSDVACLDSWAGLVLADGKAVTIGPLGTITLYVASYWSTVSPSPSVGDYLLSVRTDTLQ